MNAAESIQAAINRLTELRELAQGTGPEPGDLAAEVEELVVTLHRTIDAQLAILRDTLNRYADKWEDDPTYAPLAISAMLAINLARAILGGAK